eukprot:4404724-Alexandrium_andersonii.AAC.1
MFTEEHSEHIVKFCFSEGAAERTAAVIPYRNDMVFGAARNLSVRFVGELSRLFALIRGAFRGARLRELVKGFERVFHWTFGNARHSKFEHVAMHDNI